MAIAFHASSTGTAHANSGTDTITKPTTSAGDVLIVAFGINGSTPKTYAAPTGWTQIGTAGGVVNTKARVQLFWALDSVSSLAFTASGATGTQDDSWVCGSFTGVDTTTPIDATGTGSSNTGASSISVATFNTVTDQALELFGVVNFNGGSTFTQSSFNLLPSSNANCQMALCYAKAATTPLGATGAFTLTDGAATTGNILCYQQFALRPASVAATTQPEGWQGDVRAVIARAPARTTPHDEQTSGTLLQVPPLAPAFKEGHQAERFRLQPLARTLVHDEQSSSTLPSTPPLAPPFGEGWQAERFRLQPLARSVTRDEPTSGTLLRVPPLAPAFAEGWYAERFRLQLLARTLVHDEQSSSTLLSVPPLAPAFREGWQSNEDACRTRLLREATQVIPGG